jgi:hypothetical protein
MRRMDEPEGRDERAAGATPQADGPTPSGEAVDEKVEAPIFRRGAVLAFGIASVLFLVASAGSVTAWSEFGLPSRAGWIALVVSNVLVLVSSSPWITRSRAFPALSRPLRALIGARIFVALAIAVPFYAVFGFQAFFRGPFQRPELYLIEATSELVAFAACRAAIHAPRERLTTLTALVDARAPGPYDPGP